MLGQTTLADRTPHRTAFASDEPEAVELLGVHVHRLTMERALDRIEAFAAGHEPRHVVTVNLDYLRLARALPDFRDALNAADLAVADGMPLVWASRLRGPSLPARIAGIDLVRGIAGRGLSLFLLGAEPGVALEAGRRLAAEEGARIAGIDSPPFGPFEPAEEERIVKAVRDARPDVLLVALGAPRQDLWIRRLLPALGVPIAMGVGCTFDVLSGRLRRAPAWMRGAGLEWLYRLSRQPRHLWRRYLLHDLPVVAHLVASAGVASRSASMGARAPLEGTYEHGR